ncbi:hypothetical protein BJX76DRAFT_335247 [Aspergillus varians]
MAEEGPWPRTLASGSIGSCINCQWLPSDNFQNCLLPKTFGQFLFESCHRISQVHQKPLQTPKPPQTYGSLYRRRRSF